MILALLVFIVVYFKTRNIKKAMLWGFITLLACVALTVVYALLTI